MYIMGESLATHCNIELAAMKRPRIEPVTIAYPQPPDVPSNHNGESNKSDWYPETGFT